MTLPLAGIRVLDYSQGLAAPNGAMLLGALGADVIKVENPEPRATAQSGPNFSNLAFNRNKRSLILDISKAKGREVLDGLLRWADVMVVNMRLSARQRRHVGYEDVASINPRLIYASLTAYGEEGPEADLGGVDIVVQSRVGDTAARQPPDGSPPFHMRIFHYDMAASYMIGLAVTLALRQRDLTGKGQKVEISLLHTALALQASQMVRVSGSQETAPARAEGLHDLALFQCQDGRYVFAYGLVPNWQDFCRAIGLEQLITDPKFDTLAKREHQVEALRELLSLQFATRPAVEWEGIFKANHLLSSVMREIGEVYGDPQVTANEMITEYEQPGLGTVKVVNVPFKMSESAGEPHHRRPVPGRGEHTIEVLRELGYSAGEIEALKAAGAVG